MVILGALALSAMVVTFILSGCSEKIVNNRSDNVTVKMQVEVPWSKLNQQIYEFNVNVAARDMDGIIVAPLVLSGGFAVGEVVVPAGRDRLFVVQAFNIDGTILYQGNTTADLPPDEVIVLNIDLFPVQPMVYFRPHYQEVTMGNPFTVDVHLNMVPDISSITLSFDYGLAPFYIDSISRGLDVLDPLIFSFESWVDINYLYNMSLASSGQPPVSLTDVAGNAHVATIYFTSHIDWADPTAEAVIFTNIMSIYKVTGEALPPTSIFTDEAAVKLFKPLIP